MLARLYHEHTKSKAQTPLGDLARQAGAVQNIVNYLKARSMDWTATLALDAFAGVGDHERPVAKAVLLHLWMEALGFRIAAQRAVSAPSIIAISKRGVHSHSGSTTTSPASRRIFCTPDDAAAGFCGLAEG